MSTNHPIIVYEDSAWQNFLPLVYSRAVFQLLCGTGELLTNVQRLVAAAAVGRANDCWHAGGAEGVEVWCRRTLEDVVAGQAQLPVNRTRCTPGLYLNGRGIWKRLPEYRAHEGPWIGLAGNLPQIACIMADSQLASRLAPEGLLGEADTSMLFSGLRRRDVSAYVDLFEWPWEIILANEAVLRHEHKVQGWCGAIEGNVMDGAHLLAREAIRIGPHSRIMPGVVINSEDGPVCIGRGVTILPHCYVQGPAFIGDGSLLQAGAVVKAGTSIGPMCKVGGEIEASIIQGYSNKQHDGFLGHSYVGSWVNIAADCISSDLKNTYGPVRVPINGREVETGELFVGTIFGDHSKTGINVGFPAGAVVGFCSNVLTAKSPKFVPSFTWIDGDSIERFDVQRGLAIARKVMTRRNRTMTPAEERAFVAISRQALTIERLPQANSQARPHASFVPQREAVPQ